MQRDASPREGALSDGALGEGVFSEGELSPRARTWAQRLLRPTLAELWTFLAIALPVLAALLATLPTVDLAYQLRAGAEMNRHGIPSVDAWTFTAAGQPWVDQQWDAQVFLAAVYGTAGWTGLAIVRAALVGLICGFTLAAVREVAPGLRPRSAALLVLGAFAVMAPAMALRPQLLAMALFAATVVILAVRRRRPRLVWILPVLTVAWANVHGSFVLAPVLVGLAWLQDLRDRAPRARRTFAVAVLAGVATVITPFGLDVWRYALGLATNKEVTARVSEWQPSRLTDVPGALFWISVALVAVAVAGLWRRGRHVPWPAALALVAFAALGAVAERGVAWWPMVAVVTLAGVAGGERVPGGGRVLGAGPATAARASRGSALNSIVGAVIVVAGIALLPAWRPTDPGLQAPSGLLAQAPSGVTGALRDLATASDRVWNPQVWGSWFEFAVPAPAYALDARIEVIPAAVWSDADVVASAGSGWQSILDRYRATIVVTEGAARSPLAQALAHESGWTLAHADDEGTIWVRSTRGAAP